MKAENNSQQKVRSLEFELSLRRKPSQILADLTPLGFSSVSATSSSLEVSSVQSFSIDKSPRHYIRAEFSKTRARVKYTISAEQSEAARNVEVASWLLHLVSAGGISSELSPEFSAFISRALSDASSIADTNYSALLAKHTDLSAEHDALKSRYSRLSSEHEEQARQLLDATGKIDALERRLASLSLPADDALDSEILEWLRSHGGTIDVGSFASSRSIPSKIVEESLARLANGGHIERI